MHKVLAFALASLLSAAVARAEPARGFMLQAQLQSNLLVSPGLATYVGNFGLLPVVRLGYSGWRLAAAVEANYSTFVASSGNNSDGLHVISSRQVSRSACACSSSTTSARRPATSSASLPSTPRSR
jgi:hypothetical protein